MSGSRKLRNILTQSTLNAAPLELRLARLLEPPLGRLAELRRELLSLDPRDELPPPPELGRLLDPLLRLELQTSHTSERKIA